ncbi:MAG TPA: hypothetical protein VFS13_00600 [Steroidobacteraceae bacterium]|nr:hypothetical protein [Steroidobacteraceae bacterium]
MSTQKYTYIGKGKIYIGPYDGAGPMVFIGNCSQLDITTQEDEQTVADFTQAGGGEYDSIRRISAVNFAMTLWDLSPANLARHLRGETSDIAATPVASEAATAYKGGVIAFAKIPDPDVAITVAPAVGSGSYALGTDYVRTTSGIEILDSGSIVDATAILVGYTPLASTALEFLTQAAGQYKLLFEGLNEANSGKSVVVKGHNARLGALGTLPLIGSEFASIQVNGDLLKDLSIVTAGKSQYFSAQMVN